MIGLEPTLPRGLALTATSSDAPIPFWEGRGFRITCRFLNAAASRTVYPSDCSHSCEVVRPAANHASREFDTFIPMPFESATTIIYRTIWVSALLLSLSTGVPSQDVKVHDPGVRGGNAGAGGALPGISAAYNSLFVAGLAKFSQVDQVVQDGLG